LECGINQGDERPCEGVNPQVRLSDKAPGSRAKTSGKMGSTKSILGSGWSMGSEILKEATSDSPRLRIAHGRKEQKSNRYQFVTIEDKPKGEITSS